MPWERARAKVASQNFGNDVMQALKGHDFSRAEIALLKFRCFGPEVTNFDLSLRASIIQMPYSGH